MGSGGSSAGCSQQHRTLHAQSWVGFPSAELGADLGADLGAELGAELGGVSECCCLAQRRRCHSRLLQRPSSAVSLQAVSLARRWLPLRSAAVAAAASASAASGAAAEAAKGIAVQAASTATASGGLGFVLSCVILMTAGSAICKLITQRVEDKGCAYQSLLLLSGCGVLAGCGAATVIL